MTLTFRSEITWKFFLQVHNALDAHATKIKVAIDLALRKISVEDDGDGIHAADLDHVAER